MGLFSDSNEDEGEKMDEETETLPHQVTRMQVERKVEHANDWIRRVNGEGWDVYLFPEEPSLNQVRRIDEDLKRLYDKLSENRPTDKEERAKVLHARQAVRELHEVYAVYDSITEPVDPDMNDSSDTDGGVSNAV
ncbi:hypothetical protein G3I44_13510 [Halogeometricum borinquense]|uniref:Uncharacterized protein n=1 Tax=Halogeometricum borinquense TaxID=60847 RepID=A0A6C0UJ37_9EURY|nr:hypothetical protein [Halogeometricum borinquense]QIB75210.1 hypothetical protein G3I44_13510 [Halogeometricum borinquense]